MVLAAAIEAHFCEGIPDNQFPEATALRSMLAVTPLYHAAVACLSEPETTLGSLALMRPLLETWGHLYFLMGEDNMRDAQCRAIRLELGWAAGTLGMVRSSGDELADQLDIAERRCREISKIQTSYRCQGGPRDYGDADSTMKSMAQKLEIAWLAGLWRSSSQIVHAAGWDWLLENTEDGTSVAADPVPAHRAARLNHLVVLYSNVAQTFLVVAGIELDSDAAKAVSSAAMEILDDPLLNRMIDGEFD